MNRFTINGKTYIAKPFDFNTVCDLEECGVPIAEMKKKPTATARAYFSLCFDGEKDDAGAEIEQHMINGGTLNELIQAMLTEMNNSDFFQAISKRTETTPQKMEDSKSEEAASSGGRRKK